MKFKKKFNRIYLTDDLSVVTWSEDMVKQNDVAYVQESNSVSKDAIKLLIKKWRDNINDRTTKALCAKDLQKLLDEEDKA